MANKVRLVSAILQFSLILTLAPSFARAQAQQQPSKTDKPAPTGQEEVKLSTELLQIDAVVSDKSGKLISDLKKEDFEVLEDGKPQALSFFQLEIRKPIDDLKNLDLTKKAESLDKLATPNSIDNGRVILLIFDNLHMDISNVMRTRQALTRFVDDDVLDGDRVAILTTAGGLGILQQLTTDKTVMKRAISRLSSRPGVEDNRNPKLTEYHAQLIEQGDRQALDAAINETIIAENLQNVPGAAGIANSIVQSRVANLVGQSRVYGQDTLDTLANAIRAMKPIKGRKMAVFASDGFPAHDTILQSTILDVADAATKAGVVIYSLDTRGLYTIIPGGDASQSFGIANPNDSLEFNSIQRDSYEAAKDVMNALAHDTGGFPIFNNNDLHIGLKRSIDDNSAYYIMAYYPSNTKADGKFREIKIVVKSHPEYIIRTRKGYYAPGHKELIAEATKNAAKNPQPNQTQNSQSAGPNANANNANAAQLTAVSTADAKGDKAVRDSLSSPIPSTDIGLKLSLNYINLPQKGSLTMLDVVVEAQNLQFGKTDVSEDDKKLLDKQRAANPGDVNQLRPSTNDQQGKDERYASTLDVYVMAFGQDGQQAASYKKSIQMRLHQNTFDFVNNNGLFYHDMLALKPGIYQVRLAARQRETGLIGTTSEWIEVPDLSKKALTLSSIFIRALPPADPDDEDQNKDQKKETSPAFSEFTNQAYRLIPEGSQIDLYTVIYNAQLTAGKPDLVIQTDILRDNTTVYAAPLRSIKDVGEDTTRIPYGVRLSLKDLKPGKYTLQFTVLDRTAKTEARQKVMIEVEE